MKRFEDFVRESIKSVHADPVHGKHSKKDAGIVSIHADPVHGKHSQVKEKKTAQRSLKFTKEDHNKKYEKAHWYNEHDNSHIGPSHEEVHEKLNPSRDEWLGHKNREHLYNYSSASNSLNHDLINRDKGHEGQEWYNEHIHGLDQHLSKTSMPHSHMYVYHGTHSWNPGEKLKETKDNTLHIPTFMSTSIHKKTAGSFAGSSDHGNGRHIIRVKVQKGQKGQYLGSHSSYPEEHEFLMPRGQKLKFHPEPKVVHDYEGPVHIWDAHAIQDKPHHIDHDSDDHKQTSFSFMKSRRKPAE